MTRRAMIDAVAARAGAPDDWAAPLDRTPFERVYRGILRGLYEGRLVPGQRLVEPDLMREYAVGRGTIREVLNRLAAAGVVTIVRHRGATVRRLSRREVGEVLDLVEILVGLTARRAADNVRAGADPATLVQADAELQRHTGDDDFPGFLSAREDYYRTLVRVGGNRELARIFPNMQVHIMRLQLRHFERAAEGMEFADYAAITEAILAGDPDAAEAAARVHVRNVTNVVASAPDRAFQVEDQEIATAG